MFRRLSFRSALTATLATRMMPVLAADSQRLAEAQRTRPARAPAARAGAWRCSARSSPARWIARWTSPRRSRCAASPAARGRRRRRRRGAALSRHDLAFAASAAAIARARDRRRALAGVAAFDAYPRIEMPRGRAARSRCRVALVLAAAAAVLRPPGDRPVSGAALSFERVTYRYPDVERPALRDVSLQHRAGRVRAARRAVGQRQVHAAARRLRAGAALPRRPLRRARAARPGWTRASTARRASARSPARCFRTPRRSS